MTAITRSIIDELAELMEEEFEDLVRTYLNEAPKLLDALDVEIRNGDTEALVGPAHALKSSSADLGAQRLAALARQIEEDARQGRAEAAPERVQAVRAEFDRAAAELRALIGE